MGLDRYWSSLMYLFSLVHTGYKDMREILMVPRIVSLIGEDALVSFCVFKQQKSTVSIVLPPVRDHRNKQTY